MLRRLVIIAGLSAAIGGLVMILTLPVPLLWRAGGAILWLLLSTHELRVIARAQERCQRIRIEHDGTVWVFDPNGCCLAATLAGGSIVLRNLAWLRFEAQNGQRFAELLRGNGPKNKDWRRLQVIWRHLGASR